MLNKLFFAFVFLGNTMLFGQVGGSLKGRIVDKDNGEGVSFANVLLEQKGIVVVKTVADVDGNLNLKGLIPGIYNLKTASVGYVTSDIQGLIISSDKTTQESIELESAAILMCPVVICEYMEPLIDPSCCTRCGFTRECFYSCCCGLFCTEYNVSDTSGIEEKVVPVISVSSKIYPNPFMDYATLEIASENEISDANVKLYDISGAEVREVIFSGRSVRIEREGLAAGTYLYVVSSAEQYLANGRVVVQ